MERFRANLQDWRTLIVLTILISVLLVMSYIDASTRVNILFAAVTLAVFLGCLLVLRNSELADFYRLGLWVFLMAVLLHTFYELAHSALYSHYTEPGYTYFELEIMLLGSALADGLIALFLFLASTLLRRGSWCWSTPWSPRDVWLLLALSLAVQFVGERAALNIDRWPYNERMPVVPVLGVGLTPLLQMALLILPNLWLADRIAGGGQQRSHNPG